MTGNPATNQSNTGVVRALTERLLTGQYLSSSSILRLFRLRDEWEEDIGLALSRRALEVGDNLTAYDIAEMAPIVTDADSWQRIHVMALALARSGSLQRAGALIDSSPRDESNSEVAGIRSRLYKDMAQLSRDPDKKRLLFLESANISLRVFREAHQYYNGINAASCFLLAGEPQRAHDLVRAEVLPLVLAESEPEPEPEDNYWRVATLGECYLLLGDYEQSARYYQKAADVGHNKLGSFSSTLRQLRTLAVALEQDGRRLLQSLKLPKVGLFSGHMVDTPARKTPRFPARIAPQVSAALAEVIRAHNICFSFSSCACGGDILFLEEVQRYGGQSVVVPPLPLADTLRNSVNIEASGNWEERLLTLLARENVSLLDAECDQVSADDNIVYEFNLYYVTGLAILKARELGLDVVGVLVWNGQEGLRGGAGMAARYWREHDIKLTVIDPGVYL